MINKNNKITKLKEKIEIIENREPKKLKSKKENGTGFAFKISTELIAALIPKVRECEQEFKAQEISISLYGLKNIGDSPEVRETRYQLYVSLSKKNKWKI